MQRTIPLLAKSGYMREICALKTMYQNHSNMLDIIAQSLSDLNQRFYEQVEKSKTLEAEVDALKFDNKLLEQKIKVFVEKNNMF